MDTKRGLRPRYMLPNNESEGELSIQSLTESLMKYNEILKKVRNCKKCGRFFKSAFNHRCNKCEQQEMDRIMGSIQFDWELTIDPIALIKHDK
jgi:uncharacterized paraquat-inducible protein A